MTTHKNYLPLTGPGKFNTHAVAACATIERNAASFRRMRQMRVTADWTFVDCKRCLKKKPVAPSVPQNANQMTAALTASMQLLNAARRVRPEPPKRTALEVARQLHAHAMDAATAAQELVDALASGTKLDWEDLDCPPAKLAGDITDSIDLMTERLKWLDESEG
jgi:hypothetical protein